MANYKLDAQMMAYIKKTEQFYPNDLTDVSVEDERRFYDALCRGFEAPLPDDIHFEDKNIEVTSGNIKIRTYNNIHSVSDTVILYFHGGGFILGSLESHHSICAEISSRSGFQLISVDYPLAPEFTFPTQIIDAVDVFRQINKGTTIVAGDSAGGLLAASLCISTCDYPQPPIGQLLIYPTLGGQHENFSSYTSLETAPGLTSQDNFRYLRLWSANTFPWDNPLFAPLKYDQFEFLPPGFIISAEFDPLKDDAKAYSEKLKSKGVPCQYIEEKGMIHGYLRARHHSKIAAESFSRIIQGFTSLKSRTTKTNTDMNEQNE